MYISQCIIAKNEEDNIGHCLSHIKSVVDEQIVVDTGSTDRTVEIAEKLGAKVLNFDWVDDFSAARNFALDKARGDWIIFLDCDEYFSEQSIPLIRNTIRKISGNRNINGILTELINIDKNKNIISSIKNVSPRIFRNRKSLRYKNKIHELLVDAKSKEANSAVVCLDATNDIKIFHTGYDKSIMDDKKKNERNINLLKEELKNNPTDANLLLYISKSLYTDEQYEESLEYALKALRNMDDDKNLDYYPVIYSTILHTMYVLGYGKDDMQAMFDEAVSKYPEHPDYYRAIGLALIRSGDIKEAIEFLEKCVLYCNNYRSNIESFALGQIEKVYSELLGAYIIDDNRPKIVEISAALLNADKYDYENLSVLIKTLLTQEKEEAVIQFLSKIYDYRNFKDKIYLLKSSEVSENEKLINYYKSLMNEEELRAYKNI